MKGGIVRIVGPVSGKQVDQFSKIFGFFAGAQARGLRVTPIQVTSTGKEQFVGAAGRSYPLAKVNWKRPLRFVLGKWELIWRFPARSLFLQAFPSELALPIAASERYWRSLGIMEIDERRVLIKQPDFILTARVGKRWFELHRWRGRPQFLLHGEP